MKIFRLFAVSTWGGTIAMACISEWPPSDGVKAIASTIVLVRLSCIALAFSALEYYTRKKQP